ncbi:MAG TPA: NAD(P)-binding domain-containing protein [Thermoanaerobaculia bacterium]|jgi:predicted dinucleotide-binding enzyme|nr:NAD(P)-binding domain-containing protein [Thermoanaerobaculia bacterium]
MKIGIIGAGHIGGTTAKLFVDAGHEVAIANSRGPATLTELVAELGPRAHAAAIEEAAQFGDLVLVAIPFKDYPSLPDLRGKIVVDAMNYYPNRDGQFESLDSGAATSSQLLASHLGGARVVKAFNTIWFEHLKTQGRKDAPVDERRVIFVSGDDAEAKRTVSELIESIGFGPYDLGSLAASQEQQPGAAVYNNDLTVAAARKLAPR